MSQAISKPFIGRHITLLGQHLMVLCGLLLALIPPTLFSPSDASAYLFWPVTGFAVATLMHRPTLFWSVALGLWLWGVLGPLGWWLGTLNLLTLSGPLLYQRYAGRWPLPESIPTRRLVDLGRILVYALLPTALVGTVLIASAGQFDTLTTITAFMLYLLSDFAGAVIYLPIVAFWLTRDQSIHWGYLGGTILLVAIAPALVSVGLGAYAQVAMFLVLPFLTWVAQTTNRATLSHCLLTIFLGYTAMAYYGFGGYEPVNQVAEMASLALLMVAVYVTLDTLQAMRVDRDRALRQAEWLSLHDNRAPAMNERGLIQWAEEQADLTQFGAVIYKPVNKDIYQRSLSWEQIGAIETRLSGLLRQLMPNAQVAKLSDLTLVAIADSETLNADQLRPLLQVEMNLSNTRFTLDGAVAGANQLSDDMGDNLSKLNALWAQAVNQPYQRLLLENDAPTPFHHEERIMHFHRYRSAVEHDGLELWLQPIRALNNGLVDKAEVLARLRIGDELISPGLFLPIFHDFNYLTEFDRQVLYKTFRQFQRMHASLQPGASINVNISGATLSDQNLVQWLSNNITEYAIDPRHVGIEITETELVNDKTVAVANIQGMRQLGFGVAIDDFGTGLASFEYLNQFAVDVLKLDGQFISDVADNPQHQAIVRSMVAVARSYNLELVGEFVDNQAALECLRELGVQYAQGFHVGKPSHNWNSKDET